MDFFADFFGVAQNTNDAYTSGKEAQMNIQFDRLPLKNMNRSQKYKLYSCMLNKNIIHMDSWIKMVFYSNPPYVVEENIELLESCGKETDIPLDKYNLDIITNWLKEYNSKTKGIDVVPQMKKGGKKTRNKTRNKIQNKTRNKTGKHNI